MPHQQLTIGPPLSRKDSLEDIRMESVHLIKNVLNMLENSFPTAATADQVLPVVNGAKREREITVEEDQLSTEGVERSTSRVRQIALSLHERETTVRKAETMIANHQPLQVFRYARQDHAASASSSSEKAQSISNPSPPKPKPRNSTKKENKTDDSFIKELLEIARAEVGKAPLQGTQSAPVQNTQSDLAMRKLNGDRDLVAAEETLERMPTGTYIKGEE